MRQSANVGPTLLDDHLLEVENAKGQRAKISLPSLLASWSRQTFAELTALQAYQQHAWHAFTVQLAAIALTRAGLSDFPTDAATWRDLLVRAAEADGAGEEAFALVVDDLSKPAFMQPPVSEGSLQGFKSEHFKPSEELDVLVTSKNHDVKMDRVGESTLEHWIFALVTLQTMQGFLGAGNYGIARMNGGFSSRPCVAYAVADSSAQRFTRDVRTLLAARRALLDRGFSDHGIGFVWCVPWDGKVSLQFPALDPFFIEICRRVRLTLRDGRIVARRASSKVARIDGSAAAGNTGDPWTPVKRTDAKALTVQEAGFTYELVQELMFGDWTRPLGNEVGPFWLGQVLVRGQGKTGGYHERWVPVPPKARAYLEEPDKHQRLGKRAVQWVQLAKIARRSLLKPAILNLLQGGPQELKFDDDRAEPHLRRLNDAIDGVFFRLLFEYADADPEVADRAFRREVLELARRQLEEAVTSVPLSAARRQRSIAYAMRSFWGAAKKHNFRIDGNANTDSSGVTA